MESLPSGTNRTVVCSPGATRKTSPNSRPDLTAPIRFSAPVERAVRKPRCAEPWEFIYFRADGEVQPCCTNSDTMGRWPGREFFEYWNAPAYQALRRTLYTGAESDWCRNCVHVCYRDIRRETSHLHIMPESAGRRPAKAEDAVSRLGEG